MSCILIWTWKTCSFCTFSQFNLRESKLKFQQMCLRSVTTRWQPNALIRFAVCYSCPALPLQIDAATTNQGPRIGASELLRRIVRGRDGWFSTFLDVLRETNHQNLYYDLTGSSPGCHKQGDQPHWSTHPPLKCDFELLVTCGCSCSEFMGLISDFIRDY